MVRRCGCASDSCACTVSGGEGIGVTGAGSTNNPFVITNLLTEVDTGFDVQYNNTDIVRDVHALDFRGAGVSVTSGTDEAIVTITGSAGSATSAPSGTVVMFAGPTAPTGWLLCDGSTVSIATYPNLFAAIGTTYGGNGTSNFALPNMTDRMPSGTSASRTPGAVGGSATASVAVANLPPHTHSINHDHAGQASASNGAHTHEINRRTAAGTTGGVAMGQGVAQSNDNTTSDGAHTHNVNLDPYTGNTSTTQGATATPISIVPPWLAMPFVIKT